jgi:hypothetical protein
MRDLTSGRTMKDRLYLTDKSGWKVDAACRSMGHALPNGPYRLGIDELSNRVVFGLIAYKTLPISGQTTAQMKSYWRPQYACEQCPRLEGIPDPKGILGGIELPLVVFDPEPQEASPSASVEGPLDVEPASGEPPWDLEPPEGISAEEMAEALHIAKQLRAQQKNAPKGNPTPGEQ